MSDRRFKPALVPALGLSLVMALLLSLSGPAPVSQAVRAKMTNGCTHTPRGIPSCGAYVGSAYGANTSVTGWENGMKKRLGVHRTFWGGHSVAAAIRTAKSDVARHRLPWISFKAPYSWSQMANGKGDAWARALARKVRTVRGPVWVAIHHEPEGDGNIATWKAMQVRLAPIMRRVAPNLGYSIILMGYHEFYGEAKYRMANIWPHTRIDVLGFDLYETYGVQGKTKWKRWTHDYFQKIQRFARAHGTKWGLAETGYSDPAARRQPGWMRKVYKQLVAHGGKAFTYFNTNLNSKADWKLSTPAQRASFTRLNKTGPRMR